MPVMRGFRVQRADERKQDAEISKESLYAKKDRGDAPLGQNACDNIARAAAAEPREVRAKPRNTAKVGCRDFFC